MKFHKQTILNQPDKGIAGNCYATAIACMLDLEITQVPNIDVLYFEDSKKTEEFFRLRFGEDGEIPKYRLEYNKSKGLWWEVLQTWLLTKGYMIDVLDKESFEQWYIENAEAPYMAYGMSKRGVLHQVIYKGRELLHDPHPSNDGLESIKMYEVLIPLNAK